MVLDVDKSYAILSQSEIFSLTLIQKKKKKLLYRVSSESLIKFVYLYVKSLFGFTRICASVYMGLCMCRYEFACVCARVSLSLSLSLFLSLSLVWFV